MNKLDDRYYQCPVCGAPVTGDKCEYCGCVIYDFALISTDHPTYFKVKHVGPDGEEYIITFKAIGIVLNSDVTYDTIDFCDGRETKLGQISLSRHAQVNATFDVMEDNGTLFNVYHVEDGKRYRESWRDDMKE